MPGIGQPSAPLVQVSFSALATTTEFSATPKRRAASATTARRTSRGTLAVGTGSEGGNGGESCGMGLWGGAIFTGGRSPPAIADETRTIDTRTAIEAGAGRIACMRFVSMGDSV